MGGPRVRLTIGRMMAGVAIIAVLLAWLGGPATLALTGLGLVVIVPAAIAPPARRLEVASWACSLQPAVILLYLYATWFAAWCVLGHPPRSSLDDPKLLGPVVAVPYDMFAFSVFFGWVLCAGTGFVLSTICYARRAKIGPLVAFLLAWPAVFFLLKADPFGVNEWYWD